MPKDEQQVAFDRVNGLISDFVEDTGNFPGVIYVSDSEELQSYMLWGGMMQGLLARRTTKKTYLE